MQELRRIIFWSSILRPRILTYFCVSIKLFESLGKPLNNEFLTSYILDSITIIMLPIYAFIILHKNFSYLGNVDFESKYGSLYGNLSHMKRSTVSFLPIQCLVRIFLGFITVFCQQTSIGSIIPYMTTSVFYTALIFHQNPMELRKQNNLEKINQLHVILTAYYLLVCTDWLVLNPESIRYDIGFYYVNLILANILINFLVVINDSTKSYIRNKKR